VNSPNLDGQTFRGGASDGFVSKFELSPTAPPCAPKAQPATGAMSNAFTANWLIPQGATGCRLDVSTDLAFGSYLLNLQDVDMGNVTSTNLAGFTPEATCFYRARAYNANGTSSNSFTMAVTMAPTSPCHGLFNSDFERGFSPVSGGDIANGWTLWEETPGVAAVSNETTNVHGGTHSQRISVSGAGGIYQRLHLYAGNSYTVSVWIYAGDDHSSCYLGVDPAGGTNFNKGVVWSSATTNAGWVQKTWTGMATAHALTVYLRVVSADGTLRTGYFDTATPLDLVLPPPVAVQSDAGMLTLTWSECSGAQLEQTGGLAPANWTTVTNEPTVIGGMKAVTLAPTGSAGYFRLVQQSSN
jgi:hypothetical protein